MDQPDREAEPYFSQPIRQIIFDADRSGAGGRGRLSRVPRVSPVFLANPYLNGFIGFVFVIGVFACFWQVFQLVASVRWIVAFAANRPGHDASRAPRLLAPLAALLRARGRAMQINASSARSILDSVATRIDEARDITRYIVNLLIFLGLLGTFYGLATTVPAVVDTIRSLAPQEGEGGVDIFNRLMTGLEAQLGGMGVAFASSLLGLPGRWSWVCWSFSRGTGRTGSTASSRNGCPRSPGLALPARRGGRQRPAAASRCSITWPSRWRPCRPCSPSPTSAGRWWTNGSATLPTRSRR
jgi:hypothetical protein